MVERNDSESESLTAVALEGDPIALDSCTTGMESGDDDVGTSGQRLEDFDTDWTLSNTSERSIIAFKRGTRRGDLVEVVKMDSGEVVAVLPVCFDLGVEMEERNLILGDGWSLGAWRSRECEAVGPP